MSELDAIMIAPAVAPAATVADGDATRRPGSRMNKSGYRLARSPRRH